MFKNLYLKERLAILGAKIIGFICKGIIKILEYESPYIDKLISYLHERKGAQK